MHIRKSIDIAVSNLLAPVRTAVVLAVLMGASPTFGALEGLALFQPLYFSTDRITPLALITSARLPDSPIWAAAGRGNLLNQKWADYNTLAVGGSFGKWRAAGTIWSAGDDLYRESIGVASLARPIGQNIVGGLSISHAWIQIKDAAVVEPQNTLGLSAAGEIGQRVGFTLSYNGLNIGSQATSENFMRQDYRLGLYSNKSGLVNWALGIAKTPGFAMRYGAGIEVALLRNLSVDAGYRTNPAMPYVSARFSLGRVVLSVRVIQHDIFGISKGFGLSFK